MDPLAIIAATIELVTEIVRFNEKMFDAGTPEQKQAQIQFNIDAQKRWQDFLAGLLPKGQP